MELISMNAISCSKFQIPPLFHSRSRPSTPAHTYISFGGFNGGKVSLLSGKRFKIKQWRSFGGAISDSQVEITSMEVGEKWLLEPVGFYPFSIIGLKWGICVGDGDSRHIGYKVTMPGAVEIASSVVTVGRVAEKADIVIPVATGLHARIEQKEGNLLVTDLDSTNGTFIDDVRLTPGVPATLSPGRFITFGDTNLAIFKALKVEKL